MREEVGHSERYLPNLSLNFYDHGGKIGTMPPQPPWLETNPHGRGRNLQPVDRVPNCPAQPAAAEATPLSVFAQLA